MGYGVAVDPEQAEVWFERAARQGDEEAAHQLQESRRTRHAKRPLASAAATAARAGPPAMRTVARGRPRPRAAVHRVRMNAEGDDASGVGGSDGGDDGGGGGGGGKDEDGASLDDITLALTLTVAPPLPLPQASLDDLLDEAAKGVQDMAAYP